MDRYTSEKMMFTRQAEFLATREQIRLVEQARQQDEEATITPKRRAFPVVAWFRTVRSAKTA